MMKLFRYIVGENSVFPKCTVIVPNATLSKYLRFCNIIVRTVLAAVRERTLFAPTSMITPFLSLKEKAFILCLFEAVGRKISRDILRLYKPQTYRLL